VSDGRHMAVVFTALAVAGVCVLTAVLVVIAAPAAKPGCPSGQRVTVTGHPEVRIGAHRVRVPVYSCARRP
jgi:hypothetical protein